MKQPIEEQRYMVSNLARNNISRLRARLFETAFGQVGDIFLANLVMYM